MLITREEIKQRDELVIKLRDECRTFAEIGLVLGVNASKARSIYRSAFVKKVRANMCLEEPTGSLCPTELRLLAMYPYITEAAKAISELKI